MRTISNNHQTSKFLWECWLICKISYCLPSLLPGTFPSSSFLTRHYYGHPQALLEKYVCVSESGDCWVNLKTVYYIIFLQQRYKPRGGFDGCREMYSVFFSADSLKKELLGSKKTTRRFAPSSFFSLFFKEKSAAKRRSVFLEWLVIFLELFAQNELFF